MGAGWQRKLEYLYDYALSLPRQWSRPVPNECASFESLDLFMPFIHNDSRSVGNAESTLATSIEADLRMFPYRTRLKLWWQLTIAKQLKFRLGLHSLSYLLPDSIGMLKRRICLRE